MTSLNAESIMDMLGQEQGRKLSIGTGQDPGKTSFANKAMKQLGDSLDPTELGLGYTCRKGLKPESPNQDAWFILKLEACSIYAVFDGHGQKGHDVSFFVKENLPKLIIKDNRFTEEGADKKQMLSEVFKKTQSLVSHEDRTKKLGAQMSGTTATVCIHDHQKNLLILAHVADSTAVLGRRTEGAKEWDALQLTRDHKPDLKDERARIEKANGRVVFDGYANHRVYAKNARYPGLNMSRCLGDLLGHMECGITAEPETKEHQIDQTQDKVLLLCSDGVWEFINPKEAVTTVMENPTRLVMQSAEALAKLAWDRWIKEEGGAVVDDITVVMVGLVPPKNTD